MQIAGIGVLFVFEAVRMKDVGIGETAIGLILGASSGIFIVSSLYWARLADRKHLHKALIIWGSLGYGVLMLYFSTCEHVWEFILYSNGRGNITQSTSHGVIELPKLGHVIC